MPKSTALKTSAIFISLVLLALTSYPAFAKDTATSSSVRKQLLPSRETALKVKLEAFRDKKKASAAARINTNLNLINQKQTTQMQKHLDTMSSILDRLEARVNQGSQDIKDLAAAKDAIVSARQVIATSAAGVTTQSQKDYTIQVSSESRIKTDAKNQRDKLHSDLLAIRKTVVNAKQAVANAIKVAKEGTAGGKQ